MTKTSSNTHWCGKNSFEAPDTEKQEAFMLYPTLRITALLLFASFGLTAMSQAQYVRHVVSVNIPFDFTASDRTFPSGIYSLVATPGRLALRDSQNHLLSWLLPIPAISSQNSSATKLQFSTEGGGHALFRVWVQGEKVGYELIVSKREQWANRRLPAPAQVSNGNHP
jgi:hypothetical protein